MLAPILGSQVFKELSWMVIFLKRVLQQMILSLSYKVRVDAHRPIGARQGSSQGNRKAEQEESSCSGPEVPGASSCQDAGRKDQSTHAPSPSRNTGKKRKRICTKLIPPGLGSPE